MPKNRYLNEWSDEPVIGIPPDNRDKLKAEFKTEFSDADFVDLERAINSSFGLFRELQVSPNPKRLLDQIERISAAAEKLASVLYPEQSARCGSNVDITGIVAAGRIKWANSLAHNDVSRMNTFGEILADIPKRAAAAKKHFDDYSISERGAYHHQELWLGTVDVFERHGLSTAYTTDPITNARTSKVGRMAYHLGQLLPEEARPESEAALTERYIKYRRKHTDEKRPQS
jgi:hypothetical protein